MFRVCSSAAALLICSIGLFACDAESKPIPPADAQQHVGEQVTVEMRVHAAKKSCKRKIVFLDSLQDFQDADNLGISIDEAGEQALAKKFSTTDLPVFFLNRNIVVTGTVVRRDERTYLDVSQASQIELSKTQP